jgi:hypothetical protein
VKYCRSKTRKNYKKNAMLDDLRETPARLTSFARHSSTLCGIRGQTQAATWLPEGVSHTRSGFTAYGSCQGLIRPKMALQVKRA